MGFLFFLLGVLLWDLLALMVLSGSPAALAGSGEMILAAAFFASLWALPIVAFVSVADAISRQFHSWMRLLLFLGLCSLGIAGLLFWLASLSTWYTLRHDGTLRLILFPTLGVVALYLGRFFRSANRSGA
ncbi:hypothetical protein C2U70_24880 [Bradyrhizobium guangdongense]|nr:hypothetical protein C2U70_24880 [Bradyrhizobium guangdongense]